jgi:hypothetical protein
MATRGQPEAVTSAPEKSLTEAPSSQASAQPPEFNEQTSTAGADDV